MRERLVRVERAAHVLGPGLLTFLLVPVLDFKRHVCDLLLHRRVPVVLDRVVGTPFENLCNVCPLVALALVGDVEDQLLLKAPGVLLDLGVEMVVPALSALLADPAREVLRDRGPLLCTFLLDQPQDEGVFLDAPGPFDEVRVQDLLPPVQALHVSPPVEALGDLLPVPAPVLGDRDGELPVLFPGPVALVGTILIFSGASFVYIGVFFLAPDDLLLLRSLEMIG